MTGLNLIQYSKHRQTIGNIFIHLKLLVPQLIVIEKLFKNNKYIFKKYSILSLFKGETVILGMLMKYKKIWLSLLGSFLSKDTYFFALLFMI